MEYTQWVEDPNKVGLSNVVLILVVMEYTQWATFGFIKCVNNCLNPCCNGIYSMSQSSSALSDRYIQVLILVVMEYTQWDCPPCI